MLDAKKTFFPFSLIFSKPYENHVYIIHIKLLVGGLEHFLCFHILVVTPTREVETTNQLYGNHTTYKNGDDWFMALF